MTLSTTFGLRVAAGLVLAMLFAPNATAQGQANRELRSEVRKLGSTLRVLQITAHPGDEDGALLLYESRELGAEVTLLTLTRGESSENRDVILEPSEQGLLRTMEQLGSDAQYGAEQRFTRVVDFGFARTSAEVFDRWEGPNPALGDIVRVIRETHPEIIVVPFDPSAPDGNGQHEATVILAREAFHAAADPKKFPEQLSDRVEPWQAKRLFALAPSGGGSVVFDSGAIGTGEHESWLRQAEHALDEQGSPISEAPAPRDAVRHYRILEAAPGSAIAGGASGFSDGLDSRLESLSDAVRLGADESLQLRSRLRAMSDAAAAAGECADRAECIVQLVAYLRNLRAVEDSMLAAHPPAWIRAELEAKRRHAEHALLLATDVSVDARLVSDGADAYSYVLSPGAAFAVDVQVHGAGVQVAGVALQPEGGRWTPRREWSQGDTHAVFRGRVPADAPFTRPQWMPEGDEDGVYRILDERNATRALPPPPLQVVAELEVAGELIHARTPVVARQSGGELRTAMIAPPVSVIIEPHTQWSRRSNLSYGEIEVKVRSNLNKLENAMLSVHPASGWRVEPEHEVLQIEGRGSEHSYRFFLIQERGDAGAFPVRAVVRWGGTVIDQGYAIVQGPGERTAFAYRNSAGSMVSADVEVPENIEVGYIGVPGDPVPAALRGIGVRVTRLDSEELAHGRLGKYWAIVLGGHAVDARDELAELRPTLLRYAEQGGALLILAQSDAARFARNAPLPYPLELGAARVSNAASAVERIEAHDPVFWDPNEVGNEDFRGWSQERGHCFALHWDPHYEPLLHMGDAGQPVQEGSLLRLRYGRGYVFYTGLALDHQVSAGVPGALRLLVNLLSQEAELHR